MNRALPTLARCLAGAALLASLPPAAATNAMPARRRPRKPSR